jgi:hypothetical protein
MQRCAERSVELGHRSMTGRLDIGGKERGVRLVSTCCRSRGALGRTEERGGGLGASLGTVPTEVGGSRKQGGGAREGGWAHGHYGPPGVGLGPQ